MAWENSNRKQRLPRNWNQIRRKVFDRDYGLCQVESPETGYTCGEIASEVDHIVPGDDHSLANLQAICRWHHAKKSAAEGNAARIKFPPRNRKPESHPGLL